MASFNLKDRKSNLLVTSSFIKTLSQNTETWLSRCCLARRNYHSLYIVLCTPLSLPPDPQLTVRNPGYCSLNILQLALCHKDVLDLLMVLRGHGWSEPFHMNSVLLPTGQLATKNNKCAVKKKNITSTTLAIDCCPVASKYL